MKNYLLKIAAVAVIAMFCNYFILLTVRSPLPADYWLRGYVIAKLYRAHKMTSPKIIFVGGSTNLFGIDAGEVQREIGRPAINLGLLASISLDDQLGFAREVAKPGDFIVLGLEPLYYDQYTATWTTWVLRNAMAWNRPKLDRLPLTERLQRYLLSSDPSITCDLVRAAIDERFFPSVVAPRLEALRPESDIISRYQALAGTSRRFNYDVANLDANGDLMNAKSGEENFHGELSDTARPAGISSYARSRLVPFLAEMKARHVRVIFNYTPYLYYTKPDNNWRKADASFRAALMQIGGNLLETRDSLFFPVEYFYHSNLHLNEEGRRQRTQRLILALRKELPSEEQ